MDHLPLSDIPMLVSSINFLLRDIAKALVIYCCFSTSIVIRQVNEQTMIY